jgi:hypothetical protein
VSLERSCARFRASLERALGGRPAANEGLGLAWHEHLLACAGCRTLLEAEEALEALLATLPAPRLPARLSERVLARLAAASAQDRERDLDRLLELDRSSGAPAGLARDVLARLALERLLDALPAPRPPAGLSERVLAALAPARRAPARRRRARRLALFAAAAALVLALARLGSLGRATDPTPSRLAVGEVEPELLATLDVLENWELLMADDLDLLLASLDPVDEALLELGVEPALGEIPDPPEPEGAAAPAPREKG